MAYTVDDFMAQISGVESGGNYNATNPDSGASGRFQIMPANWPVWAEEAGLGRNAPKTPANQDRVARFKMEQYYQQFGSWEAVAVAWYAGPGAAAEWVKNPNASRFNQRQGGGKYPSINEYVGKVNTGATGGTTAMAYPGGAAAATPAGPQTIPRGGALVMVNGVMHVVYNIGNGVHIFYDAAGLDTNLVNWGGLGHITATDTNAFYDGRMFGRGALMVHGGQVTELASMDPNVGYRQWFDQLLRATVGDAEWVNDPEMRQVYADYLANQDKIGPQELQARIRATAYWRNRTSITSGYNDMSPADQQRLDREQAQRLVDSWFRIVGENLPANHAVIVDWAHRIASGQATEGEFLEEVAKPWAIATNPESPWARQMRTEQEAQLERGNEVENQTEAVRQLYDRWGVPGSDAAFQDWGRKLTEKQFSEADLVEWLRAQAQVLYPWKDPSVETSIAAEPWMQTYARILERPAPDIFDPKVQQALNSGMPIFEFEKQLRSTPEWLQTRNAHDDLSRTAMDVGRQMGFA